MGRQSIRSPDMGRSWRADVEQSPGTLSQQLPGQPLSQLLGSTQAVAGLLVRWNGIPRRRLADGVLVPNLNPHQALAGLWDSGGNSPTQPPSCCLARAVDADRHLAAATKRVQGCSLRGHSKARLGVIQKRERLRNRFVAGPRLDRERALAGSRAQDERAEALA